MTSVVFQVFVLLCCMLQASALSPGRGHLVQTIDRHGHDRDVAETEDCKDIMDSKRCRDDNIKYRICNEARERNLCQRTCHVCHLKAPSPEIPCEKTALGCCWDGVTRVREGCPECEDEKDYASLCIRWRRFCKKREFKLYNEVVNQYCHRTCGKCGGQIDAEPTRTVPKTLAPIVNQTNSDHTPRRGAMYMWTKVVDDYDQ